MPDSELQVLKGSVQHMKHISEVNLDKITELRQLLHRCPDLSLQESGTIRILESFLQENTSLELFDRDGWFYAVKYTIGG